MSLDKKRVCLSMSLRPAISLDATQVPLGWHLDIFSSNWLNLFRNLEKQLNKSHFVQKLGKKIGKKSEYHLCRRRFFAERDSSVWLTLWICASTNCYLKKKDYSCAKFLLCLLLFHWSIPGLSHKGGQYRAGGHFLKKIHEWRKIFKQTPIFKKYE